MHGKWHGSLHRVNKIDQMSFEESSMLFRDALGVGALLFQVTIYLIILGALVHRQSGSRPKITRLPRMIAFGNPTSCRIIALRASPPRSFHSCVPSLCYSPIDAFHALSNHSESCNASAPLNRQTNVKSPQAV